MSLTPYRTGSVAFAGMQHKITSHRDAFIYNFNVILHRIVKFTCFLLTLVHLHDHYKLEFTLKKGMLFIKKCVILVSYLTHQVCHMKTA